MGQTGRKMEGAKKGEVAKLERREIGRKVVIGFWLSVVGDWFERKDFYLI